MSFVISRTSLNRGSLNRGSTVLARGRSDIHCKIKETLLIRDLKPALNENVGSEKLYFF